MWTFRTICGSGQYQRVSVQGKLQALRLLVHGVYLLLVDLNMVVMVQLGLVLLFLLVLDGVLFMLVHLGVVLLLLFLLCLDLILLFEVLLRVHLCMKLLLLLALDLVVDLVLDVFPVSSSENRLLVQTALAYLLPRHRLEQNMNS